MNILKKYQTEIIMVLHGIAVLILVAVIFGIAWRADASMLLYPKFRALDSNGDPLSGGLVYTYEPGTTTAKTTYSDVDLTAANANPVVLDSNGEANIYLDGEYKIVLKDSDEVTLWTVDNVMGTGLEYIASPNGYIAIFDGTSKVSGYPTISGNSIFGLTLYSAANPSPTVAGGIAWDSNNYNLVIGDGTNTRAIPTTFSETIYIASPDLLDDISSQPFFRNTKGVTIWVTEMTFRVDQSGVTLEVYSGTTAEHCNPSGASEFIMNASLDTAAGVSSYKVSFTSGVSGLNDGYPLMLAFGGGSTANWLEITIKGRLEGNNN